MQTAHLCSAQLCDATFTSHEDSHAARLQLAQVLPKGDLVLAKVAEAEEATTGGILLPSAAQRKPTSGECQSDDRVLRGCRTQPCPAPTLLCLSGCVTQHTKTYAQQHARLKLWRPATLALTELSAVGAAQARWRRSAMGAWASARRNSS